MDIAAFGVVLWQFMPRTPTSRLVGCFMRSIHTELVRRRLAFQVGTTPFQIVQKVLGQSEHPDPSAGFNESFLEGIKKIG